MIHCRSCELVILPVCRANDSEEYDDFSNAL